MKGGMRGRLRLKLDLNMGLLGLRLSLSSRLRRLGRLVMDDKERRVGRGRARARRSLRLWLGLRGGARLLLLMVRRLDLMAQSEGRLRRLGAHGHRRRRGVSGQCR